MYYGHTPHIDSPEDMTVLDCRHCGWQSAELTRDEIAERGVPWYCDNCGKTGLHWVRFHPRERAMAYELITPHTAPPPAADT
jgi:predicted RNA-binding Zn-ribbon protein involved in translation (DUF1610 family)